MLTSLLAALMLTPGAVHAADYPTPKYELRLADYYINTVDYRFPSGLRILFQEDHTQPIVSITNWIDHGSTYDGLNEKGESVEGLAHVVEHLAFRAKHGDLPKNWDVIAQLGGILNASTSNDWVNYMTVAPVDSRVMLMRVEALRLHDGVAGVTDEDVEAEKSIARNELRQGYENGANGSAAVRTALVHLPKLLWPEGHPYRNIIIGTHETISNIDLPSVQRYVRENYRPEFSTIAMVGDFDTSGAQPMDLIFKAFAEVEHLLMSPEDAEAFQKITEAGEKDAFFANWVDTKLVPFLQEAATTPAPARVACDDRAEPPPLQSDEIITISGMVDNPTAVAAWSLPAGYCSDDINMQVAAYSLQNYILRSLDPTYDPMSQESEINGFGCGAFTNTDGSTMFCYVEKGAISKKSAEQILDDIADALYLQTAPIDVVLKPFYENNLAYQRLYGISSTLNMTDNIASLSGRSFYLASHAHYTGQPTFFSDSIKSYEELQLDRVRAIGGKYVTRERMARMVIEPMDEEVRAQLEAGSAQADSSNVVNGHAQDDRSRQLFDTDKLTPEAIRDVIVVPDVDKMREIQLDNGLQVVIMNHGEAPLVKIGVRVSGDDAVAPQDGMDTMAEYLYSGSSALDSPTQSPLRVAGSASRNQRQVYASGSSGNVEQLLHQARLQVDEIDWQMANKKQRIKSFVNSSKSQGRDPEVWASRLRSERVWPDHPYGAWWTPSDFEVMKDWTKGDLEAWQQTKWQPANAYLVVVGKIDVDETERYVREYFASWKYEGSATPGKMAPPPAPTALPERQVLLFDKPIATQSKVTLACPLKREGDEHYARTQVISKLFTYFAFGRLREEKGLTYGAYAFPSMMWGDTTSLGLATVIQNSGAAYGVQTMLDIIEEGANGELDEGLIATEKWNVARESVTKIQSGDQMLSTILSKGRENLDFFREYPDALANVTQADFQDALSFCKGHEVVTVVGPVDTIKGSFDEKGIAYEVVEWEDLYLGQLTDKEQKDYLKAKAKADAAKAREEAEAEEGSNKG
jgi:zinc protease